MSQKYTEEEVHARTGNMGSLVFDALVDETEEKTRYFGEKNKYKVLVLSFMPLDGALKRSCREYAFTVEKTERPHRGVAPEHTEAQSDKLLSKMEKRIQKILRSAEKYPPEEVCQEGIGDLFRYFFSRKYLYKKELLGKSREHWDWLFMGAAVALTVLVILVPVLLKKAF